MVLNGNSIALDLVTLPAVPAARRPRPSPFQVSTYNFQIKLSETVKVYTFCVPGRCVEPVFVLVGVGEAAGGADGVQIAQVPDEKLRPRGAARGGPQDRHGRQCRHHAHSDLRHG